MAVADEGRAEAWLDRTDAYSLPFVEDIDEGVSLENRAFLRQSGALSLPGQPLRNALFSSFIEHVHPTMPVVDLMPIIAAMEGYNTTSQPRLSILLLQAIMFSGVAHADLEAVKSAGFASRREARKRFYDRSKVSCPSLQFATIDD